MPRGGSGCERPLGEAGWPSPAEDRAVGLPHEDGFYEKIKPRLYEGADVVKVSVCGKGGSGKSTVVALLAHELRRRGRQVLVVDSDESNACLHWMLGFENPPRPLLELVGGKKHVQRAMRSGFDRGEDEPKMSVLASPQVRVGDLPQEYVRERDGLSLVAVGKIHQALEGCACPMGVLSREFLRKLRLELDEAVVVDMEAGVEHFGRGVETSVDAVVGIVEPSLESVLVTERVSQLALGSGARFVGAILNKVTSKDLAATLADQLKARQIPVLGALHHHEEIMKTCLAGDALDSAAAQEEMSAILDALLAGEPTVA
jgi:CO dehydrogenase maturation factor